MTNTAEFLELRRRLASWSDTHLEEACAFVKTHAAVIPRELGNSQLHGLANLARNLPKYSDISKFLQRQSIKAERADKVKMQQCWLALKMKFDSFRGEAEKLAQGLGRDQSIDEIHLRLVLFFMQHLIAESLNQDNSQEFTQDNVSAERKTRSHQRQRHIH